MNRPLGSKGTPRPARLRSVLLRRKGARPPALRGFEIRAARPQSLRALRFHPAHKSLSHVRATRRRARRARARASPVAAPHARADSPRRLPRAPRHLRARARASATAAAPLPRRRRSRRAGASCRSASVSRPAPPAGPRRAKTPQSSVGGSFAEAALLQSLLARLVAAADAPSCSARTWRCIAALLAMVASQSSTVQLKRAKRCEASRLS